MSLVSLEKYLYAAEAEHKAENKAEASLPVGPGYYGFSARLIEIVRAALKGQAVADLAGQFDKLRSSLEPSAEAKALEAAANEFSKLLAEFHERLKQADNERADDFRKVLSTLKDAFSQLSIGGQGADLRFQKLDESLSMAAQMDDMKALRAHLAHTLQFVRQEAARDKRLARGVLDCLGGQIRASQENVARFSSSMASREAAISSIELALREKVELKAMIFAADILKRLATLHGAGISDSLLDEFTRQNLQNISPDGKVFRWSNTSVLLLYKAQKRDAGPDGNPEGLFEYQAFLGDRVTNLRIALRSLTVPLRGNPADITSTLDMFAAS